MNFTYKDCFEPPRSEARQVADLQKPVAKHSCCRNSYLVRKIVEGAPQPFYVLGVSPLTMTRAVDSLG